MKELTDVEKARVEELKKFAETRDLTAAEQAELDKLEAKEEKFEEKAE